MTEILDILVVEDKEIHLATLPQIMALGHRVDVAKDFSDLTSPLASSFN